MNARRLPPAVTELRPCDLCDERAAKHVLDRDGVRLVVCGPCVVEARRDGIDLDRGWRYAVELDDAHDDRREPSRS